MLRKIRLSDRVRVWLTTTALVGTLLVATTAPASADPISITVGLLAGGLALAEGASVTWAVIAGVATIGLSYLAKSLVPNPNANVAAVGQKLNVGGIVPQSFPFGYSMTLGSLVYHNQWGKDGKTPNAYFVRVIAISDLPGCVLNGLIVDGNPGTYGVGTPDPNMGYAIPEFNVDGKDYLWVKYYNGSQTVVDPYLAAKFAGDAARPYDTNRIGTGRCYAIVTARYNTTLFSGIPEMKFLLSGIKAYNVRKDSTAGGSGSHRFNDPTTWEYTENPQQLRYMLRLGFQYNGAWFYGLQNMTQRRLPYDNWSAAMNDCDTLVTNHLGAQEKQYRCGGEIAVNAEPASFDESLMKACNGRSVEIGGIYKTTTGVIGTPVKTYVDESFLITEAKTNDQYPGLGGTINGVTATFFDPSQAWAQVPAPALNDSTLEVEDGDRELIVNIDYDCVPFAEQVQRLMTAALAEERRWRTHTAVLPHTEWQLEPGDPIAWNSTINGYVNKVFRTESVKLLKNRDIQVTIKEADPDDYDFDPTTQYTALPAGTLSPHPIPSQGAPPSWAVASVTIIGDGGRAKAGIRLTWDTTDIDDVDGVLYQVRLTSSGAVKSSGQTDHFSEGLLDISENLSSATAYQVRGQFRPISNREADWSTWLDVTTDDVRITSVDIAAGAVGLTALASGLTAVEIYSTLPSTGNFDGRIVFNTTDQKLYRYDATAGAWTASVATVDLTGTISSAQIAAGAVTLTKLASGITAVEIVTTLPTTGNFDGRTVYNTSDGKLYRYSASAGAFIASVASTDITGQISSPQIAAGAVTASKLSVSVNNILLDPFFLDTSFWTAGGGGNPVATSTDSAALAALNAPSVAKIDLTGATATISNYTSGRVTATAGATYNITCSQYVTAGFTGSMNATLVWEDKSGSTISNVSIAFPDYRTVAASVATTNAGSATGVAPSNAVYFVMRLGNNRSLTLTNAGQGYWGTPSVVRATDAGTLAAGAVTITSFASGITPIEIVSTLPTTGNYDGRTVFLTTDKKLYRYSAASSSFIASTATTDLTGTITSAQIAAGAVGTAAFASGIAPVEILGSLPSTGNFDGRQVFLTTDKKLYRYNATTSSFIASVATTDLTGTITSAQIAAGAIGIAAFATGLTPVEIVTSLPSTGNYEGRTVALTTDGKLYKYHSSAWVNAADASNVSGTLSTGNIPNLDTSKITTGTFTSGFIAAGAIDTTKFASGITPVEIVSTLPSSGNFDGRTVFLTTDKKLYRYSAASSTFISAVATTDLSGTITNAQIAAAAIDTSKFAAGITPVEILGTLPSTGNFDGRLVYLTADKKLYRYSSTATAFIKTVDGADIIANSITTSSIAAGAITAAVIASGTITGTQIAATTIAAGNIITGTITSTQIASATITGGNIAGTTITAANLAASTITAGVIAAGAIGTTQLAANAVTAAKLSIGPLNTSIAGFIFKPNSPSANSVSWSAGTIGYVNSSGSAVSASITASNVAWTSGIVYIYFNPTVSTTALQTTTTQATAFASGNVVLAWYAGGVVLDVTYGRTYIDGSLINVLSIQAANIAAGTITSTQIASATITGGNIAGTTITAGNLVANTITAAQIAAATITTTQIAAGTITGTNIAGTTITAANIVTSTITTTQIAANTILGSDIAAATITGSNIVANTITTGLIQAGAITASQIAASAIIASKLAVVATNLVLDPLYTDPAYWTGVSGAASFSTDATATAALGYPSLLEFNIAALTSGTFGLVRVSTNLPVQAGASYRFTTTIYYTTGCTAATFITLNWLDKSGTPISAPGINGPSFSSVAAATAGTATITNILTAPTNAVTMQMYTGGVQASSTLTNAGQVYFAYPTITRATDGNLVVSGSITGTAIAASTITSANIAADTITAGQIAAGAIGVSELAANAVTAVAIAASTITSTQIAASTILGTNIAAGTIAASNILANTITAAQIASATITTTQIAASTILGTNIAGTTITASNLAANTITAGQIAAAAIGTTQLAANAVTAAKLSIGPLDVSVNGFVFQPNSPSANSMAWTAGTIGYVNTSGAATTASIAAGNVAWTSGAVYAYFAPATSTTALQTTTSATTAFASGNMVLAWYAGGVNLDVTFGRSYLDGSIINTGSITAANIAAATITGTQIAAATITAANLVANTITAGVIAAGAIGTTQLAANAVTASQIAANTITAGQLAAGVINASTLIANNVIITGHLVANAVTIGSSQNPTLITGIATPTTAASTTITITHGTGWWIFTDTSTTNAYTANPAVGSPLEVSFSCQFQSTSGATTNVTVHIDYTNTAGLPPTTGWTNADGGEYKVRLSATPLEVGCFLKCAIPASARWYRVNVNTDNVDVVCVNPNIANRAFQR